MIFVIMKIIESIIEKTGVPDMIELLAESLSGTEINSLLLEVFNKKQESLSPAILLNQYRANRFVHPAETDMIELLTLELKVLNFLQQYQFQAIELSPVAQFGSCSVVAPVDQKKIITATRNTEVMADATNAIALHIADLKKSGIKDDLNFCTIHRHTRAQEFKGKGFSAHFKVGCMVSSGRDKGSYSFEKGSLLKHFQTFYELFIAVYKVNNIRFKLQQREGYNNSDHLVQEVFHYLRNNSDLDIFIDDAPGINNYYKGIQCKMIIEINGIELEIADGGFTDWTQQLLENKKERLLISGFGFELLYKFQNGMV